MQRNFQLIVIFISFVGITSSRITIPINFNSNEPHLTQSSRRDNTVSRAEQELDHCEDCAERKASLTSKQLREVRYDIVKQQILQKLRMTQPPKTTLPKPSLKPLLVAEMTGNLTEEDNFQNQDEDVLKMESVVLYPEGDFDCDDGGELPCSQFEFRLPDKEGFESYSSAELWLMKQNPESLLEIKEVLYGFFGGTEIKDLMVESENEDKKDQWIKLELPTDIIWQRSTRDYTMTLQVRCHSGCSNNDPLVSDTEEDRPFLIIRAVTGKGVSRNRRSVDCVEGTTGCCRESFYLNFSEIGWDTWILHPDGYYANFCRGRCVNDFSNTRFYHSAVLVTYIQDNDDIAEEMGLNMCCTPSLMSPISILYRNEDDLIYHKVLDNMKVEACDCA